MPFYGGGGAGDYKFVNNNVDGSNGMAVAVGDYNIGLGLTALTNITNGDNNVALGQNALFNVTIGSDNIAVGTDALKSAVNLSNNIALGSRAMTNATLSSNNVVIGNESLANAGPVNYGVILGYRAAESAANSYGTVIGCNAAYGEDLTHGTFVGFAAGSKFSGILPSGITALNNKPVIIGSMAGFSKGSGAVSVQGVLIGSSCGAGDPAGTAEGLISKTNVVAIGNKAASYTATGIGSYTYNDCIILGNESTLGFGNATNRIIIGNNIASASNNSIQIGDATHVNASIGNFNLANFIQNGSASLYATDYAAIGLNSNSSSVNGTTVSAGLVAWIDNGGLTGAGIGIGKAENTVAGAGSVFYGGRSRGTLAAPTIVQNGDELASIYAVGYDGIDYATSAKIAFEVDGVPGVNDMPGRIVFSVAPDGSQVLTEAVRISQDKTFTTSGNLNVSGAGRMILSDFSNATFNNRTSVKTNVANGATIIDVIPDGSGTNAGFNLHNSSDKANTGLIQISSNPVGSLSAVGIVCNARGTGVQPDFVVAVNLAERMRIDGSGNVKVQTAGAGLRVKEGANAKQGTVALVAGVAVVPNTSVTATSRIFLTSQADGGTPGFLRVSARVAGVSFTITSSNAADTSTVAYEIFEPS